eukprot:1376381-Amorphochlora_amoeboformis.AAC.1
MPLKADIEEKLYPHHQNAYHVGAHSHQPQMAKRVEYVLDNKDCAGYVCARQQELPYQPQVA